MKAAQLYETPEEFTEMMVRQLEDSLQASIRQQEGEVLQLEIRLSADNPKTTIQVSLHDAYRLYQVGGDLNAAVDYLNEIVRNSLYVSGKDDLPRLDPDYIYPAIREERYVTEAGRGAGFVSDEYLPGLRRIYLEIKDGCTKIVTKPLLTSSPGLTEAEVRPLALRNLRKGGWQPPSLSLPSPLRPSCTVDTYLDPPFPMECQFLQPELAMGRMPSHCVIAFTNRQCTLVMRSKEPMDTAQRAWKLVCESGFAEVVRRSYRFMPFSVSDRLYWTNQGKARLLKAPRMGKGS